MVATSRETQGRRGYLFTRYSNNHPKRGGRAWERSPGLIHTPKEFRWAVLGADHNEFDMDMAHAHIYVHFVGSRVPALVELLEAMRDPQRKKEISAVVPGTHKMVSTALNATNPLGRFSHPMAEIMKLDGPPPRRGGWIS